MIHQLAKGCVILKNPIIPSGKNEQAVLDSAMQDLKSKDFKGKSPPECYGMLCDSIHEAFFLANSLRDSRDRYKIPSKPPNPCVAEMIRLCEPLKNISYSETREEAHTILSLYMDSGTLEGIYTGNERILIQRVREYVPYATKKDVSEIIETLADTCDTVTLCNKKHLIPLNNGLFDYDRKQLLPFSPNFVFVAKSRTNFNPKATSPLITEPDGSHWEVLKWLLDLFDGDNERFNLCLQCLCAGLRPRQRWNLALFLYSSGGASGKGCLMSLFRALCGDESIAEIPLAKMDERFGLEPLLDKSVSVILGDENEVGGFIEKDGKFKSLVTGDGIAIERKFKGNTSYQPHLFIVESFNEIPRFRDRSPALERRIILLDFPHAFHAEGNEKPYIKNDYLQRKNVREFLLKYLLVDLPNFDKISIPESCQFMLAKFKVKNNFVAEFAKEIMPQIQSDIMPVRTGIYELYKAFRKMYNPSGKDESYTSFLDSFLRVLDDFFPGDWTFHHGPYPRGNRYITMESVFAEFEVAQPQFGASLRDCIVRSTSTPTIIFHG